MAAVFPLVAKYGGVLVALTLDESGIPADAERQNCHCGKDPSHRKIIRHKRKGHCGRSPHHGGQYGFPWPRLSRSHAFRDLHAAAYARAWASPIFPSACRSGRPRQHRLFRDGADRRPGHGHYEPPRQRDDGTFTTPCCVLLEPDPAMPALYRSTLRSSRRRMPRLPRTPRRMRVSC